ncbi:MAG: helix-turn-helix domain-containing protein [Lachnospiraceae bacterium]
MKKLNSEKLEEEMKLKGISKAKMCEELGISRSAFYRKCQGQCQFTLEEIKAITKILQLESPMPIFFNK